MLRVIIVFGLLAVVGGVATWRPDLAEKAYHQAQALMAPKPAAAPQGRGPGGGPPPVAVTMARAEKRAMPIIVEAVGTVQPIAALQIKARIDSQVATVHVAEGAAVKEGDLLFTLDDRSLKAQLAQVEAQILRTRAQLEQAVRDRERAIDLNRRSVGTEVARDNAITNVKSVEAQLASDEASRNNLQTQLSYTQIRAPISGRIGSIAAKVGTAVRNADTTAMTTINQINPIHIAFAVPQSTFYEMRALLGDDPTRIKVEASIGGRTSTGAIAFIENQVDLTTGTVTAKARMENGSEQLWPGSFVPVKVMLGVQDDAVVVPSVALQVGQNGPYVFVVRDGRAAVAAVRVARTMGDLAILAEGLTGGEQVITSGQLRLANGTPVAARPAGTAEGAPTPRAPQS
ncbi:MAG: efflux RND transporter periplasmic adaptor subunit [Phreatobacter sp.]|jgi:multidrug efflux system membrane fusion protein|uniref:efflux RND transporter periplasmic adaptor subunit n=1 Tax=Phreatobacter sp. TaxID=1966341 RepID=UPI0040356862